MLIAVLVRSTVIMTSDTIDNCSNSVTNSSVGGDRWN